MSPLASRQRRLLATAERRARETVADFTAALAVGDCSPLRNARAEWLAIVQDAARRLREFDELHGAEQTPVMPTSQSQELRAASMNFAAANAALENGRDGPSKHEP